MVTQEKFNNAQKELQKDLPGKNGISERFEVLSIELPWVDDILDLASRGNADNLIVVVWIKEMLEDLIYQRAIKAVLDRKPLTKDDCDSTTKDVVKSGFRLYLWC